MTPTRVIQMPGDTLLPPSAVPMPPAGLPARTAWTVLPPIDPTYIEKTHFTFSGFGLTRELAEREWVNEPEFFFSRYFGDGKGVTGAPPPLWRITPRSKTLPDAWEGSSCYFLSRRLVEMLESVAPGAIDKVPMRIEDRSGNLVSGDHFLVDFVRLYAAIDWANSSVIYIRWNDDPTVVPSTSRPRMLPDLPDDLTVFRDATSTSTVYIRRDIRDKLAKMKPKLRGTYIE